LSNDVPAALQLYEKLRLPRASRLQGTVIEPRAYHFTADYFSANIPLFELRRQRVKTAL
jgi:hypothetical protein